MVKVIVTTTLVFVALLAIPRMMINDSKTIAQEELNCIKLEARLLFDNPIEKIIIQSLEVEKNEKGINLVSAYTLGGLKYAIAEAACNKGAHVVWRPWLGN